MRQVALEFLRELREIERRHGQIADTDVREALYEAIIEGFVERRDDFRLPKSFEMLSEDGDALMRRAVGRFLDAANEEGERMGCSEPRDRLLLLRRFEVPLPERTGSYDDFLGGLDTSAVTPDEPAWRACEEPAPLLHALRSGCSVRKLGLFAAACCRRLWHLLGDERSLRAVEMLERHAGRSGADEGLALSIREAQAVAAERCDRNDRHAANAVAMAISIAEEHHPRGVASGDPPTGLYTTIGVAYFAARAPGDVAHGDDEGADMAWVASVRREEIAQADLIRDIFVSPFRRVASDPVSLTPLVVELSRGIYDGGAFDRLPVLGDALEEAGCTDETILRHCRSPGPHAKGCWGIDSILGKG